MNILWDFDGTLFDTYPAFTLVMQKILGEKCEEQEILKQLKVSFRHAVNHFHLSEEDKMTFRREEKLISPDMKRPFPFVEEVLKQANINVIMTHKPRDEVQVILDYYDWNDYFKEIVAGDDGFPRKPDATSYRYLHEKYQLDLAVGDRLLDLLPAKEIGISTCFFQNETEGADFYIHSYQDFFDIVKIK